MRTPLRLVTPDDDPASRPGTPDASDRAPDALTDGLTDARTDALAEPPAEPADPHEWSTGALVAAAREGDVTAFRILVERYYARCLRFARNMGLDAQDAEEAVQDALVRVHGALARFAPGAAFEPWLFRILANRCRSTRSRGRWWRKIQVDLSPRSAQSDIESIPAPAEPDADWRDVIGRALDTLPAEQREAFLLRHVEGMEYHDMMAVTGAGLSALKMRVKRASDALRARLKELT